MPIFTLKFCNITNKVTYLYFMYYWLNCVGHETFCLRAKLKLLKFCGDQQAEEKALLVVDSRTAAFHLSSLLHARRIFGPKRDEVTEEWWKLHNEELNDLYSSPNIVRVIKSKRMRWVGRVARMGERRGVYRVLVGKPEGKRPLGRPRRRWEDNINLLAPEFGI